MQPQNPCPRTRGHESCVQPVYKSRTRAASSRKLNVAQRPAARNIAISSSYMARRLCKPSRSVLQYLGTLGRGARVSKVPPRGYFDTLLFKIPITNGANFASSAVECTSEPTRREPPRISLGTDPSRRRRVVVKLIRQESESTFSMLPARRSIIATQLRCGRV